MNDARTKSSQLVEKFEREKTAGLGPERVGDQH